MKTWKDTYIILIIEEIKIIWCLIFLKYLFYQVLYFNMFEAKRKRTSRSFDSLRWWKERNFQLPYKKEKIKIIYYNKNCEKKHWKILMLDKSFQEN